MPIVLTFPKRSGAPVFAPPAADANGRFFLAVQEHLVAFEQKQLLADGANHKPLWHTRLGHVPGPPTIGPDGSVRVHTQDGFLHRLDPATGAPRWNRIQVGPPLPHAAPLVDAADNTWICAASGSLLRITPKGVLARWFDTDTELDSCGVLTGGALFVGGNNGRVYAISTTGEQGKSIWEPTRPAGSYINFALALRDDGLLVVASADNSLYLFESGSGTPRRPVRFEPGYYITSAPVLDEEGNVYIGAWERARQSGVLLSLDGQRLGRRWGYRTPGRVESTPLLGNDGRVYCGDTTGVVHTIDRNGQRIEAENVDSPVRSPGVLVAPRHIGFGLANGTIVVLRCSSTGLATGWPKQLRTAEQSGQGATVRT